LALINKPKEMANYTFVKQTEILGTAHAVLQTEPWIGDDYFMVIFGDAIYPPKLFTEMMANFAKNKKPLICVHEVPMEDVSRYGVVKLEGERMTEIVEQPKVEDAPSNLVCNGVYLLPKSIFPILRDMPIDAKRGEYLLPHGLNILMKQMEVLAFKTEPFRDIGSVELLMKANAKMYKDGKLFD
jgi:UTP--glucose-1-phosphate uridylyltransferase